MAAEVLPKRPMQSTTRSGVELEALADAAQDAAVRLVDDDEVDLVEAQAGARGGGGDGLGEALDGGAEGLLAGHRHVPAARDADVPCAGGVDAEGEVAEARAEAAAR